MQNILIIKNDASGDVVRTTVLLQFLSGNIYWITANHNQPLFPDNYPGLTVLPPEHLPDKIAGIMFDLVINLEEDIKLAKMISRLTTKKIIGVYWKDNKLYYTPESAEWFDMSLISRFGKSRADELKKQNKKSYQEILFSMFGKSFAGETYLIYKNEFLPKPAKKRIGIEKRSGAKWANKSWYGYDELVHILTSETHELYIFRHRNSLREYLQDIQQCELIICGDTLAMHISLAYKIPCIAIFNCTSPDEIYEYGILKKIISPLLPQSFYKQGKSEEVIQSIRVAEVYAEAEKLLAATV